MLSHRRDWRSEWSCFVPPARAVFLYCRCPIIAVARLQNLDCYPDIIVASKLLRRLQKTVACPQDRLFERSSPSGKWAGGFSVRLPTTSLRLVYPVTPFICAFASGTTRWRAHAASTAG